MAQKAAQLYSSHCASCHQAKGEGVPGAFPPLADDPVVTAKDPTQHIKKVLFGAQGETIDGTKYTSPMPPWSKQLSDDEVAAIVNHERTSWGNDAPTVTPAEVKKVREKGK
jgi:cytochrome c oxidase cbb3-type subunit 2